MNIKSAEQRQLEAAKAYHTACIAQYRAAAAKFNKYEKISLRAMDNAQFHERKLKQVEQQLSRFN